MPHAFRAGHAVASGSFALRFFLFRALISLVHATCLGHVLPVCIRWRPCVGAGAFVRLRAHAAAIPYAGPYTRPPCLALPLCLAAGLVSWSQARGCSSEAMWLHCLHRHPLVRADQVPVPLLWGGLSVYFVAASRVWLQSGGVLVAGTARRCWRLARASACVVVRATPAAWSG